MKIDLIKLRALVDVDLQVEPEDHSYEGDFDDETCKAWIRDQLERGNEWAWCSVKLSVTYKGITCCDYLGGCSYESKKSFVEGDGYYDDMVDTAVRELASELESLANDHAIWEHDAVFCFWCIAEAHA